MLWFAGDDKEYGVRSFNKFERELYVCVHTYLRGNSDFAILVNPGAQTAHVIGKGVHVRLMSSNYYPILL